MTGNHDLEQLIRDLDRMSLGDLRTVWRRRLGVPPTFRSSDLFRRMLAYELQATAYGGLSTELKQSLRAKRSADQRPPLQPGTVITREWRGERHVVDVRDDGFEHLGTSYRSLSEVARAITGAKWSGPRFFGLTPAERKAA